MSERDPYPEHPERETLRHAKASAPTEPAHAESVDGDATTRLESADSPHATPNAKPTWDGFAHSLDVPSLLIVTRSRCGPGLGAEPEDVLQDAFLRAWKAWEAHQWSGWRAARSWLLTIIDHVAADLGRAASTLKRGGSVKAMSSQLSDNSPWSPACTSTPSRRAMTLERAQTMRQALAELPDELREVVYLRLFEQCELNVIAARTGLSFATVQHRVRRGAVAYARGLRRARAVGSSMGSPSHG
jgi:RNA polymerase sigma factor (sigma-70 family)